MAEQGRAKRQVGAAPPAGNMRVLEEVRGIELAGSSSRATVELRWASGHLGLTPAVELGIQRRSGRELGN